MAKPSAILWDCEPHTKAKHAILRSYLNAWIPILGRMPGELLLIDGFAGPGEYLAGEDGSPLIMLKAYLEHGHRDRIVSRPRYLFIEDDAGRVAHLREKVAGLGLPTSLDVQIEHGSYADILEARFAAEGVHHPPTFAFIDPFGYAETDMELTSRILAFPHCDVLIYVPLSYVARFINEASVERSLSTLFGSDVWKRARAAPNLATTMSTLRALFRDVLAAQWPYVRSFQIDPAKPNTGYCLFFATGNKVGLQRMKGVMWKVDPVGGHQYQDTTATDQPVLFDLEPDLTVLEAELRVHFGDRWLSISEAQDYTLVHTPFRDDGHLKPTLKLAEASNRLDVAATVGRRRGTFPAGTRLRFVN
jgi:three-Cys-motif partner protein